MEEKQEARKVRRKFSAEQKFEILKDIERGRTIKEGLERHRISDSLFRKWKRQLEVGVRASLEKWPAVEASGCEAIGSGESKVEGGGVKPSAFDQRVKKRDELGLRERGRLMASQKRAVMDVVERHRSEGRTVNEVLGSLGVARSSYYRWRKSRGEQKEPRQSRYLITAQERRLIEEVKQAHPEYRHRRIQGVLQSQGVYLSASVIYVHLRQKGWVEAYERRAAPWKGPRYEVWQRNLMWGCDWTRLLVGGVRWYLLTVIDFFSRLIVAYEVVPTVHAGDVKAVYQAGLKGQGISVHSQRKPELRVDRGSPNTSWVTQEFFEALGAELSFARVRRPTDNALTERFYGTVKQEEIYLVGNYPDETSAREEIGRYIETYHRLRPHQALFNFTPAHVHKVNNKSALLQELSELKRRTREKRKAYWADRSTTGQQPIKGGCLGKGQDEIVDPGANTEEIFDRQQPDFQKASDEGQK